MRSFSNTLQCGCCVWNLNQIAALQGTSVGGISCAGRTLGGLAGFSVASSCNCPFKCAIDSIGLSTKTEILGFSLPSLTDQPCWHDS